MNDLITLQHKFQKYLMHSDYSIQTDIVNAGRVPVEIRLGVYSHAYRSRLVEALAANYPILQIYLGVMQFEELGHAYIDEHPSTYRSIRWFGDRLEKFLETHPQYGLFPYLAELAKLEWTMTLVFDAAESCPVAQECVINIPPEKWADMRLTAHPSLYLVEFTWNVVSIWQDITHEKVPLDPMQNEVSTHWVFWRKDFLNQYCLLPDDEAYALAAILKGKTFGEICEGLCQWVEVQDAAVRAASLLKGWILSGLIAEITT